MTFLFALSFACLWQSLWHRFSAVRVLEVPVLIPDIWTQFAESSCAVVCVAAMRFDISSCMVCMMTRMPWYIGVVVSHMWQATHYSHYKELVSWGEMVMPSCLQEKELQECTFSPKIKTMPSYIHRIAKTRTPHGISTSHSSAKYAERAAQRTREWV